MTYGPPCPTLETDTNRELVEAFCKRFGLYAFQSPDGTCRITAEKPELGNMGWWFADPSIVFARGLTDGPWQDSLIGPQQAQQVQEG